jgi:AraC-like DNA-binding protein
MGNYNSKYHYNKFPESEGILYKNIILHQIGDIYCGETSQIPEHVQYCSEITCAVAGEGRTIVNGRSMPLGKGSVNIVFPGDTHEIISEADTPLRYYFFAFTLLPNHPAYENYQKFIGEHTNSQRTAKDSIGIIDTLTKCLSEISADREFSNALIEAYALEIIVNLLRVFNGGVSTYSSEISKSDEIVFRLINYVDRNITSIKGIGEVYAHIGYSASYVSHVFLKYMGISPARYLYDARMNHALQLIKKNTSITDVADILGYSSIHPFCRAFSKKFGKPPSHFFPS